FVMAGPAYMQSTTSKGVSASDSGLGYIIGAVSYYDVRSFGLPAWMNGGAQFIMFSRQTDFGSVKKYVVSNQIQLFMGARF
ncbi:MAG: hypothetical protein NZ807_06755, partial [Dehalococcoidia bacterium]|nr:hypothetical protein [Dehalococcoidia bacterium]